jgi:hypothetical protein
MSLKKSILNLFVDLGDDGKEESKQNVEQEQTPTVVLEQPKAVVIEAKPAEGKTDTAIAENLANALEEANIDGYDYFEYAKTLEALSATIPSEQVRYQTAFASAGVMGATKEKLIETAQHYTNILNEQGEKFSGFVAQQIEQNVTSKESGLTQIDSSIQEKAELIQKLTQEINELTQQKTEIANEVAENKIKIERVQNDFAATLKVFLNKIKKDMDKISTYIP